MVGGGALLGRRGGGRALDSGKVIDSSVSHIDIFPTICDLLDIPRRNWLQGESMLLATAES